MSKIKNRLIRKALFALAGTVFGGIAGKQAADALEGALDMSQHAGELLEVALSSAGGLAGPYVAEMIEDAIWSEGPPNNPQKGQAWMIPSTNQLFVWTGTDWLGIKKA